MSKYMPMVADKAGILELLRQPPCWAGLTTNPTLMRKAAGINDYEAFARDILQTVKDKSISFEVFSDDFADMRRQALKISKWQDNVYVKIPITNTRSESSLAVNSRTGWSRCEELNVTAILTVELDCGRRLNIEPAGALAPVSVFAADCATPCDPRNRSCRKNLAAGETTESRIGQ